MAVALGTLNLNDYNVGTDMSSVTISDDQGNAPADWNDLGLGMEIDASADDTENTIRPITNFGLPRHKTIPNGWTGTITWVRQSGGGITDLQINKEQAWYTSGVAVNFTISCTVRNNNGGYDQYQFQGVQFSKIKLGNFRSEKEVDITASFKASQLLKNNAAVTALGTAGQTAVAAGP